MDFSTCGCDADKRPGDLHRGEAQMPPWWPAAVAAAAVLVALSCGGWRRHGAWASSPTRLVREEDLHRPLIDSFDEEEKTLLAKLPKGPGGLLRLLLRSGTGKLSQWLRLDELQEHRWKKPGRHRVPEGPRMVLRESLLTTAAILRLMGCLLPMLVLLTLLAYWILSVPGMLPAHNSGPVAASMDAALRYGLGLIEWIVLPLLLVAARVLRISREEALGEERGAAGATPEMAVRVKRALLGLLVLNVLSSFAAALALACLVAMVRLAGGLEGVTEV